LPDYIEERTLPVIPVEPLELNDLLLVIERNVSQESEFLEGFERWYTQKQKNDVSVRQAIALVKWAIATRSAGQDALEALTKGERNIFSVAVAAS
jgi:hypothetical protein